jgi:hypothetical protein
VKVLEDLGTPRHRVEARAFGGRSSLEYRVIGATPISLKLWSLAVATESREPFREGHPRDQRIMNPPQIGHYVLAGRS